MNDKQLQTLLSKMMIAGVLIAAGIMAAGTVWYLATHPGKPPGDHIFSGEPKYFENPISMFRRAFEWHEVGHRRSAVMIGVLLLLINPIMRVAFAAWGYRMQKDLLYTFISLIVLAVLLVSFFW